MKGLTALLVGLAAIAGLPTAVRAFQVEYVSPHPVPHKYGGGFCAINVPHTHNYRPGNPRLFRAVRGQHYFVGDPTPFGYDGPRYAYYGAHPVLEAEMHFGHSVFCYLKGPHFHWYQPPPQAPYQLAGGAYWYVGTFPTVYYQERPRYAVINQVYAPMPYTRPTVDVAVAPAVVRAEISLGGPGWRASAVVGGPPSPVVAPPAPVVAPPAPVIAPPSPGPVVEIGVGINLGGSPPVVAVPAAPPGHVHHDHGRHEGHRARRPSRFILGPAPVRGPLLQRQRKPASIPRLAPAARPAAMGRSPAPAPGSGSAVAPQRGHAAASGHNDHRRSRR